MNTRSFGIIVAVLFFGLVVVSLSSMLCGGLTGVLEGSEGCTQLFTAVRSARHSVGLP